MPRSKILNAPGLFELNIEIYKHFIIKIVRQILYAFFMKLKE